MKTGFLSAFSALKTGRNRHWSFVFLSDGAPSGMFRNCLCILDGPDVPPVVGRLGISDRAIRQPEIVRLAPLRIPSTTALCNF
jgi:hypothetical protein